MPTMRTLIFRMRERVSEFASAPPMSSALLVGVFGLRSVPASL
jgi:hypothetical protein